MQLMNLKKENYADRIIFNNNAAPATNYRQIHIHTHTHTHTHLLFMQTLAFFNSSTEQLLNEHYQQEHFSPLKWPLQYSFYYESDF